MSYRPRRLARADVDGALALFGAPVAVDEQPAKTTRKRGKGSNRRRGTAVEGVYGGRGVEAILHEAGYEVLPRADSIGYADVVGLKRDHSRPGPEVRRVQAKRLRTFAPSGLNDAVKRYLGLGKWRQHHEYRPGQTREAWLWADDCGGWVAYAELDELDRPVVTGEKASEVLKSLQRMLDNERAAASSDRNDSTFLQRITGESQR